MKAKKIKKFLKFLALFFVLVIIAMYLFLRLKTYPAQASALEALLSSDQILVTRENSAITFDNTTQDSDEGFMIYPGGLVAPEAYAPLCHLIAQAFDRCFIVPMPLNFAIINPNKGGKIISAYPEITRWTLVGHSLGGPAAARYIQSHPGEVQNLVLLGSYSDVNISDQKIKVLSVLGSEDGLIDKKTFESSKPHLPSDTVFKMIEGGNHSQMGEYGFQKGDEKATISSEEQRGIILRAMKEFIN